MKIRFQARAAREVEIRDLRGHRFGVWRAGQEEEIDPAERAEFRQADGAIVVRPVIESLFSCGPDFVDAATDRNPFYTCDECGEVAIDEHFTDRATLEPIYVRRDPKNEFSPRLCLTDFLAEHPDWEQHHVKAGAPTALITEARSRRKVQVAPAPVIGASYGGVAAAPAAPAPAPAATTAAPAASYASAFSAASDDEGHE